MQYGGINKKEGCDIVCLYFFRDSVCLVRVLVVLVFWQSDRKIRESDKKVLFWRSDASWKLRSGVTYRVFIRVVG